MAADGGASLSATAPAARVGSQEGPGRVGIVLPGRPGRWRGPVSTRALQSGAWTRSGAWAPKNREASGSLRGGRAAGAARSGHEVPPGSAVRRTGMDAAEAQAGGRLGTCRAVSGIPRDRARRALCSRALRRGPCCTGAVHPCRDTPCRRQALAGAGASRAACSIVGALPLPGSGHSAALPCPALT